MKRFLITLAAGYLLLTAVIFLMGQAGHKDPHGKSKPAEQTRQAEAKKDMPPKDSGKGFSDRENSGPVKTIGSATVKVVASSGTKNFQTFYSDGRVSSSWTFKEGVLDGTVVFFHPNGAVWMEYPFQGGQETGMEKEYAANGPLLFEKSMMAGAPQGEIKQYYPNGKLWMRAVVSRGSFDNVPDLFSENGEGQSLFQGSGAAPGAAQGVFRVLTESGAPKAEWNGAGQEGASVVRTFFDDGKPSSEWPVKDGKPHGSARFFYPGGSLWREIVLENGVLSGKVTTYYPGGALQRETSYAAGRKSGPALIYYEDGSLWAEFSYEEGRLSGMPKAYSQGKSEPSVTALSPKAA